MSSGAAVLQLGVEPDQEEAARFIAALAGSAGAVVTFQTFDDRADGQDKDPSLNRIRHGTLDTYWRELVNLNRRGAGVYVMVNEGDGKGRGASNVTALRAAFLDDDTGDLDPAALLLTPSIVVRSKSGLHVYWKLRPGEPTHSFTSTQEELADRYGTDASVKDLPRVLRLPGFLHLKDRTDPFMVRLVSTSPAVYSIAEVLEAHAAPILSLARKAPPAPSSRVLAVQPAGTFGQAVEAFNAANPWPDLPSHNRPGPCPICGDSKSFHEHPAGSGRWACLSSDHPAAVGIRKASCYVGDALDLWAHVRGTTRREGLATDGYLHPLRSETAAPHAPPATPAGEIVLSVSDIFAPLPPVSWVCQALDMAPGAPVLAAGYGFSGKTVAMQDFALATASGSLAWGRFPVREGRVLHLDYEQGSYLTRLRYQRLAAARDLDPRSIEGRLVVRPFPPWYLDAETDDFLAGLVDGFDLVIVDSFRAACPETEENSSDARVPLDRLTRLSERTGALSVVLHHARKPSQDPRKQGGGARMAIRGSGALYDACGSVLVFASEKGEPVTVEHEKARITGRTHDPFRLSIEDVEVRGDPRGGLRVSVVGSAPVAKQTDAERLQAVKGRVLDFVREQGGTTGGKNVLKQQLGGRRETLNAAIDELVREGFLVWGGTTRTPTLSRAGTT